MQKLILGIESSCDDTSIAVWNGTKILSNITATQDVHRKYGGVVPEVASRAHQVNIIPTIQEALRVADIEKTDISAIAFTAGPGLLGSLLVGVSFAKGLAISLGIPLVEVNHMKGHVLAHFLEDPKPSFPFLCLTVSGGHTQIILVRDYLEMEILGQTIDDAAGEAFDKTGKLLGLDYPAGPIIDKLAQKGIAKFEFPKPQIEGLDFSFSGLKTSILYFLKKQIKSDPDFIQKELDNICASVQLIIVDILIEKLIKASQLTGITEIAIAGGVSANSGLRKALETAGAELNWNTHIPKIQFCTDNAAMIAIAGYYKYLKGEFSALDVVPRARMKF